MAFSTTIILGSCSFLLGMIFVSQVVDIPLLYMPVTDLAIENAYQFYGLWWESPGAVKALFHVALALPLLVLLAKLHKWSESAMFFDGSGICAKARRRYGDQIQPNMHAPTALRLTLAVLQVAVIILYLTVHVPSMRTFLCNYPTSFILSSPVPESTTTTSFSILPTPAPRLVPPTEAEKIESVRVLAAGNALVGLLLLGVMGMQIGQEYARRVEEREQRELDRSTTAGAAPVAVEGQVVESKKDL